MAENNLNELVSKVCILQQKDGFFLVFQFFWQIKIRFY